MEKHLIINPGNVRDGVIENIMTSLVLDTPKSVHTANAIQRVLDKQHPMIRMINARCIATINDCTQSVVAILARFPVNLAPFSIGGKPFSTGCRSVFVALVVYTLRLRQIVARRNGRGINPTASYECLSNPKWIGALAMTYQHD